MSYSASTIKWALEEADRPWATREYREALGAFEVKARDRAAAPVEPGAPDSAIRGLAKARAGLMADRIAELPALVTLEWLNSQVSELQGREFEPEANGIALDDQLQGFVRRATCPLWWRRQLRRVAVRTWEASAQAAGRVSVRMSQPYVTNETVQRRQEQAERNRAMLQNTEIESQDGERITLWAAVQASTANKAIRRGELMTRIKGAEEWATARGMVGIFTTNTLPSRFHAQHFKGGANAAYDGSTTRDGQRWLCKTWARLRAKLARQGVGIMGYRVAEPHHDGCPHWHMLLWTAPEQAEQLQDLMRAEWLKDAGDEPGAQLHRVKFERIEASKGGAIAYVAKYIAKNIDDFGAIGAEGHADEINGEVFKLDGDGKARRVEAWAAEWGIRQFQALGQPPVTVWRELRRVDAQAAQCASSHAIRAAGAAVHRTGERRACWRGYIDAQGGAMLGRKHPVKVRQERSEREGRYGRTVGTRNLGVYDVRHDSETLTSQRRQWRGVGEWTEEARQEAHRGLMGWARDEYLGDFAEAAKRASHPWTRFNNCTRQGGAGFLMDTLKAREFEAPGGNLEIEPCPIRSQPPRLPKNWQMLRTMHQPSAV